MTKLLLPPKASIIFNQHGYFAYFKDNLLYFEVGQKQAWHKRLKSVIIVLWWRYLKSLWIY